MFDLDLLDAFDKGLAGIAPNTAIPGRSSRLEEAPDRARGDRGAPALRCALTAIGAEPLCPYARTEAAA
jgi:hypothetical protein